MRMAQGTPGTGQIIPFPRQQYAEGSVSVFDNPEFGSVRIVMRDEEPWFVAKDVAAVLDLGNMHSSLALLDDDEKGVHTMDTLGGGQEMVIISESGLYSLILRSRKSEARAFKRWVTHDILPSIRKTGGYSLPNFNDPISAAEAWIAAEKNRIAAEQIACDAIRTKAEIGTRREATAMATASTASRKVYALEDTLGRGRNYRQVKAIEWLREEFDLSASGAYSQIGKKAVGPVGSFGLPDAYCP